MKTAIIVALLASLAASAAVDAPDSITLIRPDPDTRVPKNSNLTYGFTSSKTQYWGLVQNIKTSYTQPDGSTIQGSTYGPAINGGGDNGYTPDECRSFPGTTILDDLNASQVGQYVSFHN
jgi:hypothetical protein